MAKRVIKVAKVPRKSFTKQEAMQLLATLCYHYPQYTLAAARRLPYKRVVLLVRTAQKMEATKYYNLTHIAAAPHSEKGRGVKRLLSHFEKEAQR